MCVCVFVKVQSAVQELSGEKVQPVSQELPGEKGQSIIQELSSIQALMGQIAELESLIKNVKGVKDAGKTKIHVEVWEAELKLLKDKQRKARPLPARLQAATDRLAKAKLQQEEAIEQAKTLKEKLEAAERELMEANAKVTEAEKELQAVTELAAIGSSVTMVCQMADFTAKLIGGQGFNLPEQVVEALQTLR